MEASEQQGAPAGQAAPPEAQQAQPVPGTEATPAEVGGGTAVPPGGEPAGQDADREPATEQSTVASAAQRTITGDPGFREQNPQQSEGGPQSVDTPVGTSMPAPEMQSGMPLPEDRAAAAAAEEEKAEEEQKAEAS